MSVEDRLKTIGRKYAHLIENLMVLNLTDETLKIILKLRGGTTLRVAERWRGRKLVRYSYYWLDAKNKIKIGWDNAPHHKKLNNFPHHKHLGEGGEIAASFENCLEDVIVILEQEITP